MADLQADPLALYLARVAGELRLPDERTREVIEELASHVADATAALVEEGLDRDRARLEALARLGNPGELGRGISAATRTRRRLLAGATGGVWAAARAGIGGLLLGYAAVILAVLALLIVVSLANRMLGVQLSLLSTDRGWGSMVLGLALWIAAARAAAAAVAAVSVRSRRPPEELRPWVAGIGGLAAALLVGWLWPMSHNWASVIVVGATPVVFAVAALRATGEPLAPVRGSWRRASLIALLLLAPLTLLAFAGASTSTELGSVGDGPYGSMAEMDRAHGYDRIGVTLPDAWRPPDGGDVSVDLASGEGVITLTASDLTALSDLAWRDVRLEVWPMEFPGGLRVTPGVTAPLATAPATGSHGVYRGTVRIDGFPGLVEAGVAMTGVGPDGQRYVLAYPQPVQTTFRGTIVDWFAAVLR